MKRPDIKAIKARERAATPAPWVPVVYRDRSWRVFAPKFSLYVAALGSRVNPRAKQDAAFVGHAREDISDLLAYVEELEADGARQ